MMAAQRVLPRQEGQGADGVARQAQEAEEGRVAVDDLEPGWLAREMETIEAEIAAWSPGIRESFETLKLEQEG